MPATDATPSRERLPARAVRYPARPAAWRVSTGWRLGRGTKCPSAGNAVHCMQPWGSGGAAMATQVKDELAEAYTSPTEQAALEHLWIHQAAWRELAIQRELRVFERGEGIYLYDIHGKRYIDAMAGLMVVNVGHGRAELAEAAAAQMRKLAYVSSASYTSVPTALLSERIAELTPGDLSRVFF